MLNEDNYLAIIQEAYELVTTACNFDKSGQYVDACDYYDKAILHLDEALNKFENQSALYSELYELRTKYEGRLEILRNHESSKNDISVLTLAGGSSKAANVPKRRMSRVVFDENMDPNPSLHGHPGEGMNYFPGDGDGEVTMMRQPYAVLRLVRNTIESGGFLSPNLYIPNSVWKQFGVKLAGLSAKTTAIEQLILLIEFHFESLCYPLEHGDHEGLASISDHIQTFLKEICNLQNSLSKPFPFIREISSDLLIGGAGTTASTLNSGGSSGRNVGTPSSSNTIPSNTNTTPSDDTGGVSNDRNQHPTDKSANSTQAQGNKWTSMVAGFGKSVVKYAETSYQRLGAMTTRISDEEFNAYTVLLLVLCEKCQILDKWHGFLEKERGKASSAPTSNKSNMNITTGNGNGLGMSSLFPTVDGVNNSDDAVVRDEHWNQSIEGLLINMISVSLCIQEVFCEIILRDIDTLTKRYMRKMRKSFSIMHWDDPDEFELDS